MQRQTCTACNSVSSTKQEAATQSHPIQIFLFGLGVLGAFAVSLLALTALLNPALAGTPNTMPSAERQRELTRFVRQECGFCHGIHLTGGLGSPLTAQALAGKPPEALEATILYGRTGTAMPGWTPHLNEADASWIVTALLKGFPQ
jgi:cytochrome c55X